MQSPIPQHYRFAILAADVALFTVRDGELLVRMYAVHRPPHFSDAHGLPGGLIDPKETAEQAVKRFIESKAGVAAKKVYAEQLYTFSDIHRDPRGRIVSVAYLALVPWEELSGLEQVDTVDTWWSRIRDAKKLAFDHDEILSLSLKRLESRCTYTTLVGKLMPAEFTLTELENAYKGILGTHLDKRNFRKKILKLKILTKLPRKRRGGRSRPAQLYKFASRHVKEIETL